MAVFGKSLGDLGLASPARALGSVKLLADFGHRIGYLSFDIGPWCRA